MPIILNSFQVAPSIALTQFGGLFSAGAEAVLCKFTLSGAGRPNMLPRLPASIRNLSISFDGSHLAVVLGVFLQQVHCSYLYFFCEIRFRG